MKKLQDILPVFRLETAEQALALLNPKRADMLRMLDKPASASELARRIGEPAQKVNYHLKSLEKVGLVRRSGTRQVKNLVEVLYEAVARTFIIPDAFGWPEELRTRMKYQGALRHLLSTAEQIRNDAARLMDAADNTSEVPSAALEFEVDLPDEAARAAFIREYTEAVRKVAGKFKAPQDRNENAFRVMAVIYPQIDAGGMEHER